MNHLDDIVTDGTGVWLCFIAQQFHYFCAKNSRFNSLSHGVRGQKQSLVKQTVLAQSTAALPTDSWNCKPLGRPLYQIAAASDIASSGCQSAAGIFNQGAHY